MEEGRAEGRKEGRAEGRKEGLVEGLAKGRAEVARNLLNMGMSVEDISKATGIIFYFSTLHSVMFLSYFISKPIPTLIIFLLLMAKASA